MTFELQQRELSKHGYRKKALTAVQICSTVLLALFVAALARAQTTASAPGNNRGDTSSGAMRRVAPSFVSVGLPLISADGTRTNIDPGIIKEFDKAWRISCDGTNGREGVVLIFRTEGGGYTGMLQGVTNEYKKSTFKWNPAALAIVHTHPNSSDPRPAEQDKRVADKYGIPNFTITNSGMYVYNPATKKTSKLLDGLDWLDPVNLPRWAQEMIRSVDISLHQVPESVYIPGSHGQMADK